MPEINKSLLFNNKIEMIQKDNEIRLIDTQEFNVTGKSYKHLYLDKLTTFVDINEPS